MLEQTCAAVRGCTLEQIAAHPQRHVAELVRASSWVQDGATFRMWAEAALRMASGSDASATARRDALCIEAVHDALVTVARSAEKSEDAATYWFEIIAQLLYSRIHPAQKPNTANLDPARDTFLSVEVANCITRLLQRAVRSAVGVTASYRALCALSRGGEVGAGQRKDRLCTKKLRDALISIARYATTAEAALSWCSAICRLTFGAQRQPAQGPSFHYETPRRHHLRRTTRDNCRSSPVVVWRHLQSDNR